MDPTVTIGYPTGDGIPTTFQAAGYVNPAGSSVTATVVDFAGNPVATGTTNANGNNWAVTLTVPAGGPYTLNACITGTTTCAPPVNNLTAS